MSGQHEPSTEDMSDSSIRGCKLSGETYGIRHILLSLCAYSVTFWLRRLNRNSQDLIHICCRSCTISRVQAPEWICSVGCGCSHVSEVVRLTEYLLLSHMVSLQRHQTAVCSAFMY